MTPDILTSEEAAEYQRLYAEYAAAIAKISDALKEHGMESDEFRKADAAAGKLWVKMRELHGDAGQHWMES